MNIVLWVLQVLLGLAFLAAGTMKATQPLDRLSKQMDWVAVVPPALTRFIGVSEILGGIGLILPAVTGIATWLTPVAAAGLALVMLLGAGFHLRRGDPPAKAVPSSVLFVLVLIVAVGRGFVEKL